MRRLTFILCGLAACHSIFAGPMTPSGKEIEPSKQTSESTAASLDYYGDREFDLTIFGTYALTGTEYLNDRYLGTDHAFGAGLDAKYFFARYFGFGLQGYVLDADDVTRGNSVTGFTGFNNHERRAVGAALGTFTFRVPIQRSRFAPYAFVGGGAIFGGGRETRQIVDVNSGDSFSQDVSAANVEGVGQAGGGLEIRFTRHFGLTSDFSWNVVNGPRNNFGMARTGFTFAF